MSPFDRQHASIQRKGLLLVLFLLLTVALLGLWLEQTAVAHGLATTGSTLALPAGVPPSPISPAMELVFAAGEAFDWQELAQHLEGLVTTR